MKLLYIHSTWKMERPASYHKPEEGKISPHGRVTSFYHVEICELEDGDPIKQQFPQYSYVAFIPDPIMNLGGLWVGMIDVAEGSSRDNYHAYVSRHAAALYAEAHGLAGKQERVRKEIPR